MRFQIDGARKSDGEDVSILVDADSLIDCRKKAEDQGILISNVFRTQTLRPAAGTGNAPPDVLAGTAFKLGFFGGLGAWCAWAMLSAIAAIIVGILYAIRNAR